MKNLSGSVVKMAVPRRIAQFRVDDSGNMTTLAVGLFFAMAMMGGVAVDLMRYEATRTGLQQTLDRSVLAAAALSQNLEPVNVVNDYFAKAGMAESLTSVIVDEGINFREVTANATASTDPIFMHMIGYDEFDAPGRSRAEQRITNVDISLVLDVSGSMAINNRLVNLKAAASEFVSTVLTSDTDNKIAIQIVPFNGQVNLGATLSARYNLTHDHQVAGVDCVDLPASVYNSTGISTTLALPVTAYADTYSGIWQGGYHYEGDAAPYALNRWCPPSTTNVVRLPTNSVSTLQSHINGLSAIGATSINAGMKWGLALLDPGSRNMFTALRTAGQIPSFTTGRPFDFTDSESLKVVVLMTDGEHFDEERVTDGYKSGNSTVWRRNSTSFNELSVFHDSRVTRTNATSICNSRPFWVPHINYYGEWHSRPWNGTTPGTSDCYVEPANLTAPYPGVTQLIWPLVWGDDKSILPSRIPSIWQGLRVRWVAWHLYARPLGNSGENTFDKWYARLRSQTPKTTMDSQLSTICGLAKNNGVVVYGIAFEAPINGQTAISNCATSNAHYFNASGLQIRTAFRTIANNISQLRLTQ